MTNLMNSLLNANLKVFGIEGLLSHMVIGVDHQIEAGAPAVVAAEAPKATNECHLLAKITYRRVAGEHFTKMRRILRHSLVEAGMETNVELRPKALARLERRNFRNIGPHVEYAIDVQTDLGRARAESIAASGINLRQTFHGTPYENVRWVMSPGAMIPGKDEVTLILTPYTIPNFLEKVGYKAVGNPMTVGKRIRRSDADGSIMFEGRTITVLDSEIFWEGGDGNIISHPCKDHVVAVDTVILHKEEIKLPVPVWMTFGYVLMDGSDIAKKILTLTDGAHAFATTPINKLLDYARRAAAEQHERIQYFEGDGIRFTCDNGTDSIGQAKGHAVARYLAHRTALFLDTKKEYVRIDNTVRFVVMSDLHRPKVARFDPQMITNFRLAEGGFVQEAGLAWIDRIAESIGDPEALTALFMAFMDNKAYIDTYDLISNPELTDEGNGAKTKWVLGAMAKMTEERMFVVEPNGDIRVSDFNLTDGQELSVWGMQRLAARMFRHLTEKLMDTEKARIPLPESWALRAYAMFDISIMDHKNPKYNGKGFFLSNGVLQNRQGVAFNHSNEMVEGPACTNRQPSGWIGEMVRVLELTKAARYRKMRRSPFLFLSCAIVTVDDKLETWLTKLIGAKKLAKIINLWGKQVPFIVIANAIVGGGDLDDLHFVWTDARIVSYLRAQGELVLSYPDGQINLNGAPQANKLEGNRYATMMRAKAAQNAVALGFADRVTYYKLVDSLNKGGLISTLTNANLIWTERWNAGDPMSIDMSGFNRHQEEVIDSEVKTGSDVAGGREHAQQCFQAVKRVSHFFGHRVPAKIREDNNVELVNGALDLALAEIKSAAGELKEAFNANFLDPEKAQIIDYMMECPVSPEAAETARLWRNRWSEVRKDVYEQRYQFFSGPDFEKVTEEERVNFAVADSVKAADQVCWNEFGETVFANNPTLLFEAMVAAYKAIMLAKPFVKDGVVMPKSDAFLFQERSATILRDAMRMAKVRSLYPVTTEEGAQQGVLAPELKIDGPALTVVNGWEKAPAEDVEKAMDSATRHIQVVLRHLDPASKEDMTTLWKLVPKWNGQPHEAVMVIRKNGNKTQFAWIHHSNFSAWHHYAGGKKEMSGTLARSVNFKTGEYNKFSATVHLNLQ